MIVLPAATPAPSVTLMLVPDVVFPAVPTRTGVLTAPAPDAASTNADASTSATTARWSQGERPHRDVASEIGRVIPAIVSPPRKADAGQPSSGKFPTLHSWRI